MRRDGQTLEPEVQLGLSLLERRGAPPLETLSPAEAREAYRRRVAVSNGLPVPVGAVWDLTIDGAAGRLAARLYSPAEPDGPCPLVVFFHRGGFVLGDLDTHDAHCRLLCRHAGAYVLSVDYRLAPEHPFPAAVEDGRAALRWATTHGAELGADLADPRLSVLHADGLGDVAPAFVVTAGFDPLRDEGEAYAEALRGAGRPLRRPPALPRPRPRLLQRHRHQPGLARGPDRSGRYHARPAGRRLLSLKPTPAGRELWSS